MMRTRLTLAPGQRGTRKLVKRYGDRLVCVRYRYDAEKKKRYKTVELIVEETAWEPPSEPIDGETIVGIKVEWGEVDVAKRVKRAGGVWDGEKKLWALKYSQVEKLGLQERMITDI